MGKPVSKSATASPTTRPLPPPRAILQRPALAAASCHIRRCRKWTGITPALKSNRSAAGGVAICDRIAIPNTGCPANGSSCSRVKMRTRTPRAASTDASRGTMNVVSDRFVSRAEPAFRHRLNRRRQKYRERISGQRNFGKYIPLFVSERPRHASAKTGTTSSHSKNSATRVQVRK